MFIHHVGKPLFTAATAVYKNSPGLAESFMITPKFDKPYSIARVVGNMLHVPRNCVPRGEDRTIAFPPLPAIDCKKGPRSEEQAEALKKSVSLLLQGHDHCIASPTGSGKCGRKGSLVVMADGTTKKVEDVVVGDKLAGPFGQPRTVLSLGSGVDPMVKITPTKGEPFWVNEDHILSLKRTKFFQKNGNGGGGKWVGGEVVNISVKEYLGKSKTFKHQYKLWRSGPVEFNNQYELPVHPYLIGVLLGDGGLTSGVVVHKEDAELIGWLQGWALHTGHALTKCSGGVSLVGGTAKTTIRGCLRELEMLGKKSVEKSVPDIYKTASIDDRLQLIAGMLDTDGSLRHDKSCYDWISGSRQLAEDFVFVCRSVGLAAYVSEQTKGIKSSGFSSTYWRVCVSGDTERIPCKIVRKQAQERTQKKDWLVTGFTVEKAGSDEYYGFTLDGDHLYLMGDFTVTHNTYMGCSIANQIGQPTLIVVTKEDLMKQWYDTLINLIGVDPSEIGHIQGSKLKYKGCRFTLAMIHSLVIDGKYDAEVFNSFGMVVFDESGSKDTLVTTSKGQIRFEDLVRNKIACEVLSYNTASNIYEWKPILAYHEHPPRNQLMRITHEHGYLDFTNEHLFYTDRGWLPVRELVPGDCLYLDTLHTLQYNNSEPLENEHGVMATRHSVGGRKPVSVERRAEGEAEVQPLKQTIGVSAGKIPETKGFCSNPPQTILEWWLGGREHVIRDHPAKVVSPLLSCKLFGRGKTDTTAIDCTARPTGVVGLVDDGRRDLHRRVSGIGFEQIPRAGRERVVNPVCAEGLRQLCSSLKRLVYHIFSGGQQIVEAGTNAVLHTKYAVQVGGGSLGGKNLPVQSMWGRHPLPSRSKEGSLLQEGDMSEGEKIHELPSRLRGSIRAGQRESSCMGAKTRVLSVTPLPEPDLVYDIEVADNHNFVANGVVVHNCHRVAADTFGEVCHLIPAKYRLGLTATPSRADGKWKVIEAHLGPVMVKGTSVPMSPKVLVKKTGWKLPVYPQFEPALGTNVMKKMQVQAGKLGAVVKRMGASEPRNSIILRFVLDAYKAGRTTVVMSEQIEGHLHKLEKLFIKAGIPPLDIGYYISKDQSPHKRIVLATYAMCSEGTNFEHWDALVLATPRASVKQAIGRIMRFAEGKKKPVVLDLRDDDSLFEGYYYSRLKEYHQVQAEIVQV